MSGKMKIIKTEGSRTNMEEIHQEAFNKEFERLGGYVESVQTFTIDDISGHYSNLISVFMHHQT